MSYEEKMIIKGSIKRSIEYKKRYIEDCENGLIDDIEGCYSAKEEILRLESEIELLEYELKIAILNDRYQDIENIKSDIIELENELRSLGY